MPDEFLKLHILLKTTCSQGSWHCNAKANSALYPFCGGTNQNFFSVHFPFLTFLTENFPQYHNAIICLNFKICLTRTFLFVWRGRVWSMWVFLHCTGCVAKWYWRMNIACCSRFSESAALFCYVPDVSVVRTHPYKDLHLNWRGMNDWQ